MLKQKIILCNVPKSIWNFYAIVSHNFRNDNKYDNKHFSYAMLPLFITEQRPFYFNLQFLLCYFVTDIFYGNILFTKQFQILNNYYAFYVWNIIFIFILKNSRFSRMSFSFINKTYGGMTINDP